MLKKDNRFLLPGGHFLSYSFKGVSGMWGAIGAEASSSRT